MKLVEQDGRRIAAITYDGVLDDEPELLDAVTAAASLTLRSDRLQAELRAEVEFLDTVRHRAEHARDVGTDGRVQGVNHARSTSRATRTRTKSSGCVLDVFIDPSERGDVEERFAALAPDFPAGEHENAFTKLEARTATSSGGRRPTTTRPEPSPRLSQRASTSRWSQAERELERERDVQTTVFETIPSVMVVLARDGTIRDRDADDPRVGANRAFRLALGWPDSELVGRPFLDLVVDDDEGRAARAIASAAEGIPSEEIESELASAEGDRRAFAWAAVPIADVTGWTDGLVLVSGMDVTERRRLEDEKERERYFSMRSRTTRPAFCASSTTRASSPRAARTSRSSARSSTTRASGRPALLRCVRRPGRDR